MIVADIIIEQVYEFSSNFLRMQIGSTGGLQFPQAAQVKVILLLSGCNRPKFSISFENTALSKVMLWLPNIGSS